MATITQPLRMRRTLQGSALTSGADQLVEFFLPLYAGAALGLGPIETAVLVAATEGVAFLVRPLAGAAADRFERTRLAAIGAGILAVACSLFALASSFPLAVTAAALVGAGSGLFWVAASAVVAERLRHDSGAFAKLMSAEETGDWMILTPAILLVSLVGYQWIFAAAALCCLAAAALFLSIRQRREVVSDAAPKPPGSLVRRLRPLLAAIVVTMAAEAAIGLLLLLHLQRAFNLGVIEIALVFLPGAIAMGVLPPVAHRFVVRFGRRRALVIASLASALFATGLAFAPNPIVIAVLWILSAAAWATVFPIQQAAVVETAGEQLQGRAIGVYEAAALLGAFLGSLAAGIIYESGSWMIACLVCAIVIAAGALLVPGALRRLGVDNYPQPESAEDQVEPDRETVEPQQIEQPSRPAESAKPRPAKPPKAMLIDLAWHTGIFAVAVTAGVLFWPGVSLGALLGFGPDAPNFLAIIGEVRAIFSGAVDLAALAVAALRIWVGVWIIDCVWTAWTVLTHEPAAPGEQAAPTRE